MAIKAFAGASGLSVQAEGEGAMEQPTASAERELFRVVVDESFFQSLGELEC